MKIAITLTNDSRLTTPRTADEVNAILRAHGITIAAENMGDGRQFFLPTFNSIKIRRQLVAAGFGLTLGRAFHKHIIFTCY